MNRPISKEILWLSLTFGISVLLLSLLFGGNVFRDSSNINFHDSYFVISNWLILFVLFLFLTFFLYFTKELAQYFKRVMPNWILTISGLFLIITLTILIRTFSIFSTFSTYSHNLLLYPPSSSLDSDKYAQLTDNQSVQFIITLLTVTQTVVLIMLVFACYCWGVQKWKKVAYENINI